MEIKKQAEKPTANPSVHALAKPVARTISWLAVAAGTAALVAAAVKTLRED